MVCMTFVEPKVAVVSFHLWVIIFCQKQNYFNHLTTYYLHKRDFAVVKTLLDKRGFFSIAIISRLVKEIAKNISHEGTRAP